MVPILDDLLMENDIAAIVDGGAASNVPVELAWKRVRDGKLGTRNACYLAFDCFHPQWDPKHLWLVPITQAIQLQMVRNAPYADHLVRFAPTLSPANLAPSVATIDRACEWGQHQRRQSDSGDGRAAATDMVGRRRPTRACRRAAREVGGVADERGDGRDPLADQPFRALAKPPPDLSAAGTADVPASERQATLSATVVRAAILIGGSRPMLEVIDKGSATESHPVPLLFVHGAGHAAWCWDEHFLDFFADKGFRAVAVSLRGHGASPCLSL